MHQPQLHFIHLLLILAFVHTHGAAQVPQLIKDINGLQAGSDPIDFVELGSKVLFWANNGNLGHEPHLFDPTTGIVSILMDIYPGSESSYVEGDAERSILLFNGFVYFSADHPDYGEELWRTNGSIIELVADIDPGPRSSAPDYLTLYDNGEDELLYFAATVGSEREIHAVDDKGSYILSINLNGSESGDPQEFTPFQGRLFFSAEDVVSGRELWSTDGKAINTKLEVDILKNLPSSNPIKFFAIESDLLLFSAEINGIGRELCAYDGTDLDNLDLYTGISSSVPDDFIRVDNQTYFTAYDDNGDRRYYRISGSSLSVTPARILDSYNPFNKIDDAVSFNNKLYYLYTGDLWELSGSTDALVRTNIRGEELELLNDQMFIIGQVTFLSDGTLSGTVRLAPISNQAGFSGTTQSLRVIDNVAYFNADGPSGKEMYSNTESSISNLLADINLKTRDINLRDIISVDDIALFNIGDTAIWGTGGTETNTTPQLSHPDTSYFLRSDFYRLESDVVFSIDRDFVFSLAMNFKIPNSFISVLPNESFLLSSALNQNRLFSRSGLQEVHFSLLEDIYRYSLEDGLQLLYENTRPTFIHWNEADYYVSRNSPTGLYKNDDNILIDVSFVSSISNLTATTELLYFTFETSPFGKELWKTDGTSLGTAIVEDINPCVNCPSDPHELTVINDILYFVANDGTGTQVWKTDGTMANTVNVTNGDTDPQNLMAFNGDLYFVAEGQSGSGLWKFSVNANSAQEIGVINNSGDSYPTDFFIHNHLLYFTADDGTHGRELWSTDGTVAGTQMVADINLGNASSSPSRLTTIKGRLVFIADHPSAGRELFSLSTCPDNIVLNCESGECEMHSSRLDSKGVVSIKDHKTLYDRALSISAKEGVTVDGTLEVIDDSLLEIYTDGCETGTN